MANCNIDRPDQQPPTAREAAGAYLARGWCPIPVPYRQKGPNLKGWQQFRCQDADLDRLFPSGPLNVGVSLGAASGGLIDLDLDCAEARAAAQCLAPPTGCVWGRQSAPDSHLGYVVAEPPNKATTPRNDPARSGKGARLLEIRSTGGQTIMPPSVLPADLGTGKAEEPCVWFRTEEPARVELSEVVRAADHIAAAALLGRYWPTGNRHDCALALAGGLFRARWPERDVIAFLAAVCAAAGDDETGDRLRAVTDTAERIRAEGQATGWPRLARLLGACGDAVVRAVCGWCGTPFLDGSSATGNGSPKPSVRLSPRPSPRVPDYVPFPVAALPTALREFVTEVAASVDADPAFAALPTLTVTGAAIGAAIAVSPKRGFKEYAALWTCTVADSGTGKSPSLKPISNIAFAISKELKRAHAQALEKYAADLRAWEEQEEADSEKKPVKPVRENFAVVDITIERLTEMAGSSPRGLVVVRDELAGWFGSFCRYKGASGGSDVPNWLSLFDVGHISYHRRTGEPRDVEAENAFAAVCGGTQPDILRGILADPSFIASGLAARLMFAAPPKHCPRWSDAELSQETEQRFTEVLNTLRAFPFDPRSGPVVVGLDYAARERFKALNNEFAEAAEGMDGGPMAAVLPKAVRFALRLALVWHCVTEAAAGRDPGRGCIGDAAMAAGEELARWFVNEAERVYATLAEQPTDRATRQLRELIARKSGRMRPRDLQRSRNDKYPTVAAAELALDGLVSDGYGTWEDEPTTAKGGTPTRVFVMRPESDTRQNPTEPPRVCDAGAAEPPDTTPGNEAVSLNSRGDSEVVSGSVGCRVEAPSGYDVARAPGTPAEVVSDPSRDAKRSRQGPTVQPSLPGFGGEDDSTAVERKQKTRAKRPAPRAGMPPD